MGDDEEDGHVFWTILYNNINPCSLETPLRIIGNNCMCVCFHFED